VSRQPVAAAPSAAVSGRAASRRGPGQASAGARGEDLPARLWSLPPAARLRQASRPCCPMRAEARAPRGVCRCGRGRGRPRERGLQSATSFRRCEIPPALRPCQASRPFRSMRAEARAPRGVRRCGRGGRRPRERGLQSATSFRRCEIPPALRPCQASRPFRSMRAEARAPWEASRLWRVPPAPRPCQLARPFRPMRAEARAPWEASRPWSLPPAPCPRQAARPPCTVRPPGGAGRGAARNGILWVGGGGEWSG